MVITPREQMMYKKNVKISLIYGIMIAITIALFFPGAVLAQQVPSNANDYLATNLSYEQAVQDRADEGRLRLPSIGEVAFKMVVFLGIVLLLLFGLSLAFQKVFKGKLPDPQAHQEVIKVLSYRKFDPKRGIYLIDVLGKILVVGADIDGLNLITEITDREQVEKAHTMVDMKPDLFTFNPFHTMVESFSKQYRDENSREKRKDRESRGLLKKINDLKSRLGT
jgi:flagellar biogenesis protein FliO